MRISAIVMNSRYIARILQRIPPEWVDWLQLLPFL
jgi:hypothetical protein